MKRTEKVNHDELPARVERWIRRHGLLQHRGVVVVGVSGGADSVALLDMLVRLRPVWDITVYVAHVNHRLRGGESDADEAFVAELADRLGVACSTTRIDVAQRASSSGLSVEAAARDARYAFFEDVARRLGASAVAVAHTRDDQAETVLMRLLRGAGLDGLCAMRPDRPLGAVRVIRPLLDVRRTEIEEYLQALGQAWRIDSSNRDVTYYRNRIRHELLPLLERSYQPNIREILSNTADCLRAEQELVEQIVQRTWRKLGFCSTPGVEPRWAALPVTRLRLEPLAVQRGVFRQAVGYVAGDLRRMTYQHWREIEALLDDRPGGSVVDLPGGWRARKQDRTIYVESASEPRYHDMSSDTREGRVLDTRGDQEAIVNTMRGVSHG